MLDVDWHFDGRQVLVTGGTSGIGEAIAAAFAASGAEVIVTGRTEQEAVLAADRRPQLSAVALDVTDQHAIEDLIRSFDKLDVLVNCAGLILRNQAEFDIGSFEHVVNVNLTGTMRMCTACRPLLAAAKGSVLNMASMLSFFGSGYVPGYSASKGGIAQLTKSLAIAWAPDGIRVNALAPGWIETALTKPLRDEPQRSQQLIDRTPLRRWGVPEDIAGAALFLSSSAARFITGVVLPIDGGYSIA